MITGPRHCLRRPSSLFHRPRSRRALSRRLGRASPLADAKRPLPSHRPPLRHSRPQVRRRYPTLGRSHGCHPLCESHDHGHVDWRQRAVGHDVDHGSGPACYRDGDYAAQVSGLHECVSLCGWRYWWYGRVVGSRGVGKCVSFWVAEYLLGENLIGILLVVHCCLMLITTLGPSGTPSDRFRFYPRFLQSTPCTTPRDEVDQSSLGTRSCWLALVRGRRHFGSAGSELVRINLCLG